jgi:hypothetical protein
LVGADIFEVSHLERSEDGRGAGGAVKTLRTDFAGSLELDLGPLDAVLRRPTISSRGLARLATNTVTTAGRHDQGGY